MFTDTIREEISKKILIQANSKHDAFDGTD